MARKIKCDGCDVRSQWESRRKQSAVSRIRLGRGSWSGVHLGNSVVLATSAATAQASQGGSAKPQLPAVISGRYRGGSTRNIVGSSRRCCFPQPRCGNGDRASIERSHSCGSGTRSNSPLLAPSGLGNGDRFSVSVPLSDLTPDGHRADLYAIAEREWGSQSCR